MKKAIRGKYVLALFLALTMSLAVLPVAAPGGLVQADESEEYTLVILHTNDVHAHYLPFDAYAGACDPEEDEQCWGGSARLGTMVDQIRGEGGNVLLVDAGDQFQGTLFFNQYKGQAGRGPADRPASRG